MGFFSNLFKKKQQNNTLSKKELTENFAELIKERFPDVSLTIESPDDPDAIALHMTDTQGETSIFYPDNYYHAYLQGDDSFQNYQQDLLASIDSTLNPTDEEPVLLPAIKSLEWMNTVQALSNEKNGSEEDNYLSLPLAGDLIITFALDTTARISYLRESELTNYSADKDLQEVYRQATEQFKPYVQQIKIEKTEVGYFIYVDGNYDASLILSFEQWGHRLSLEGAPVIALIARDALIICDGNKPEHVALLGQYAKQKIAEMPYALSDKLYTFQDGKLALYSLQ